MWATPSHEHLMDLIFSLPQVHICLRFMKLVTIWVDLPLQPSWMPVEDHGPRFTQKSLNMQ